MMMMIIIIIAETLDENKIPVPSLKTP